MFYISKNKEDKMPTPDYLHLKVSRKNKYVQAPENGWEPETWYIVEVAFSPNNVIHRAVFYSGFITKGLPCGYNEFVRTQDKLTYSDAVYIKVVERLFNNDEKLDRKLVK